MHVHAGTSDGVFGGEKGGGGGEPLVGGREDAGGEGGGDEVCWGVLAGGMRQGGGIRGESDAPM